MKRSVVAPLGASIGMLILILDSKTALAGAQEGIEICIRTVIPSLFPFFVLSILLTGSLMGLQLTILRPLGRLMGVPQGAESILLAGFLGGYPAGAQSVAVAVKRGQLSALDGRRMLSFCNNCGPAFLFGMIGVLFPYRWVPWVLWGIHILSAILVSRIFYDKSQKPVLPMEQTFPTLSGTLISAMGVMASVCGWVILFRILLTFLQRWIGWLLPTQAAVILSGILELSNGCIALHSIEHLGFRFVLCSGMLAFGGLCVGLQTVSVAQGIDMALYFPGKILQCLISILLSLCIQGFLPAGEVIPIPTVIPGILVAFLAAIILKNRKRSSIPAKGIV